jgi:hypothetical protein
MITPMTLGVKEKTQKRSFSNIRVSFLAKRRIRHPASSWIPAFAGMTLINNLKEERGARPPLRISGTKNRLFA